MGDDASEKLVRQFRQIVLWPLQLMPWQQGEQIQKHWELLAHSENNPWSEVADEFTGDPSQFKERHYSEFVTFLPYVQRFLYGQGVGAATKAGYGESPIKVFRRSDIAKVRMTYNDSEAPALFDIAHIDLYFFYDLDITILVVEIFGQDLSLERVQDALFRSGRAYPAYWEKNGQGSHCPKKVEWISPEGVVRAVSDYEKREKYLSFVCRHRAPCISSHWEYVLKPMVLHHSDEKGLIRYRQIEHFRMPLMAYLALEDPSRLTRGDFVRLAMARAPGDSETLPYAACHLKDFEQRYCYDRYWDERVSGGASTRFMCGGNALIMVGNSHAPFFTDSETGLLGQFRHQYFLLFLIAHFHKAALLMLSDRLMVAISKLDIRDADSVRQFKRSIRHTLEIFLRFTHRYWFHEVSDQAEARHIFNMLTEHLGTDRLFAEAREEIQDMSDYLDGDGLRRQANTVVRLTVVTTFGLIGTVATGFLGMNLIAEAEQPLETKIVYFFMVFIPTVFLTFYTLIKSKRLSDFLDAISDERLRFRDKFSAFLNIWKRRSPALSEPTESNSENLSRVAEGRIHAR
jgi:hypothetical protein